MGITGIKIGVVRDGSGKQASGAEYPRKTFDAKLWAKMKAGDKMILPANAKLPDDLGSFSSCSFGAALHLTKLDDAITGSVVGVKIDSL